MHYEGEFEKQPGEILQVTHDFSADMDDGESISVPYVTVIRLRDGLDVSSDIIPPGSILKEGTNIHYGVKGGDTGEKYKITVRGATDQPVGNQESRTFEVEHLMTVKER